MKINDITIKVNHFGPLEGVSFKLAPMMIFTGMSSLGKSYANYLVYYFMSAVCNGKFYDIVKDDENIEETWQYVFDLDAFFKELSERAETYMRKFLGDDELKCDVEFKSLKRNRTFTIELKKVKTEIYEKKEEKAPPFFHASQVYEISFNGGIRRTLPHISYVKFYVGRELQDFVLGDHVTRAVILPPGRGAFVGENFSMKSEVASSMNMYNLFFRDYDNGINNKIRFREENNHHLSDRLLKLTSGGELLSVEGKQYLQLDEGHRIALSAGASSVKDLSPWLFYLKDSWILPYSFCMEEPEAHQHPSVTVQIADVMAIAMHQFKSIFHLTTHSDYLIQRLNQLVKLGSIRRKNRDFFKKICDERGLDVYSYLDAKDIHAYYFRKGEKGKTVVEKLDVTDDGIPMKSFFDVVRDLENREEYINDAIYSLDKNQL